jgi:hypothetical protein
MNQLCLIMAARHLSPATLIHKELQDSKHDLLWQDTVHHTLDPSYRDPKSLPTLKKTFKITGVASRWPCQQTASNLHTFWKRPNTAPPPTPAIHQVSPTELQSWMPHQLLGSVDHKLRSHYSFSGVLQHPYSLFWGERKGDVGTSHQLRMTLSTRLSSEHQPAVHCSLLTPLPWLEPANGEPSITAPAPPPQQIRRTCILWLNQCTSEHQKINTDINVLAVVIPRAVLSCRNPQME